MPEIYVGLTEEAIMTYNDDEFISREVDIRMPDNPSTLRGNLVVLEYERKQSPYFWLEAVRIMKRHDCSYIASHENPLMTPAAGAVSVFFDLNGDVSYVSFCQKDDKAPRDPGFRVPRNGFPQSESDWFTNAHLYREAFEEGLIMTRKGELVLPEEETYDDLINAIAGTMVSRTGLKINGTKRVPIEFRDGYDRLRVYRGDAVQPELVDEGVISWTPETGINFIKVMEVQYPLEELHLVDGETLPDGTPLQRDVCVLDLAHLQGKVFGDPIHETVHRYRDGNMEMFERDDEFYTDKVPRSVLNQIIFRGQPVYPIDWMDESEQFLSQKEVLKNFNGFKWSQLEKAMLLKKR